MVFKLSTMSTLILLLMNLSCSSHPQNSSPNNLIQLNTLRDQFLEFATKNERPLDFVPQIKDWTRPSLSSWREESKTVAIPLWEELSEHQLIVLGQLFGSDEKAKVIFPILFRWFLIPHELTHAIQTSYKSKLNHWKSEKIANDVATAFLNQDPSNKMRLKNLVELLIPIVNSLPRVETKGLSEEDYFESEYQTLGTQPLLYGNFQLRFILSSLQNRENLKLEDLFKHL